MQNPQLADIIHNKSGGKVSITLKYKPMDKATDSQQTVFDWWLCWRKQSEEGLVIDLGQAPNPHQHSLANKGQAGSSPPILTMDFLQAECK
jgi:hypothetical protein